MFAKNKNNINLLGGKKDLQSYKNPDNDPNGEWVSTDPSAKSGSEANYFEVKNPFTGKIDLPPSGRYWLFSQNTIQKHINSGTICFKKEHKENERGFIYKRYKERLKTVKKTLNTLDFVDNQYMNQNATKEAIQLGIVEKFKYPKGSNFIKKILEHATDNGDIILDFFAGSGTTGHAVLELNNEDGGNRQFILCTNNENSICEEVTYPRISKVINGYKTPKDIFIDGLGGNLDHYKTDLIPIEGISNITDVTREELAKKAGNMIGIKENTHLELELSEYYQIFINEATKKQTAIYFTEDLSHFDELIEKTKSHLTKLYIFSFGKIDKSAYQYLGKNYQIEDIPEPIIEIYKEINKEGIL